MVDALGGGNIVLETTWNFVTGMGLPHPIENGLAWHPTLGVPYLSGSGVKGLLRAWVEEWMDELDDNTNQRLRLRQSWFGMHKGDSGDNVDAAGDLIFFDAIPVAPVELTMDIMTPHMGKWYENGGKITNPANQPENVPADWHDPVPVPFLAVKKAKFLFSIVPSQRLVDKAEGKKVLDALIEAIEMLGAGAKTAAGYGRIDKNDAILESLQEKIRKKREELQRQEKLAAMTPLEREIAKMLHAKPDKNLKDYVLLLQKLENGHWLDNNERKQVALKIKAEMEKDKVWRLTINKPEKDKDYKRTLAVMKYLQ